MNIAGMKSVGMVLFATTLGIAGLGLTSGCVATPEEIELLEEEGSEETLDMAEQPLDETSCPFNMTSYRGQNGYQHACYCPASATGVGTVWGTDIYTDDSALCRAAVHAGVISTIGGSIVATVLPGQSSYVGSLRNGVSTSSYGYWPGSFSVAAPPPPPSPPPCNTCSGKYCPDIICYE
jgi:hypothetical protein